MQLDLLDACPLCDTPSDALWEGVVTWFKVDDKLHSHAKVMELGDDDSDAMALWVLAGSWASDQLTDGWIPRSAARRLDAHFERRACALVRVGLWHEEMRNGVPGWVFHGWNEPGRQPTAEQVLQERSFKSARQQRWREKNRGKDGRFDVDGDVDASTGASRDGGVDTAPTRPDPTLVTATQLPKKNSSPSAVADGGKRPLPEGFEEFWRAYPRRVGKQHAIKAYVKALAQGVSPALLATHAAIYAMEQRFTDKEYIKHPATWLNAGCWEDEPATAAPIPLDASEAATLPPMAAAVPGSALAPVDAYGGDRYMARQANRYPPKPSTTDQRVAEGLRLAEYYRSQGR